MLLYRGVNSELDKKCNGQLVPKGTQSKVAIRHDGKFTYDGTATYGESADNAVRAHQIETGLYDGCYISTTTDYKIAKMFATCDGKNDGFIYVLDSELFEQYGVIQKKFENPKYPNECEISIRAEDCRIIPAEVIIAKIKVS